MLLSVCCVRVLLNSIDLFSFRNEIEKGEDPRLLGVGKFLAEGVSEHVEETASITQPTIYLRRLKVVQRDTSQLVCVNPDQCTSKC